MHNALQDQVDADRRHVDVMAQLNAEDSALRAEHLRLTQTPSGPNQATLARLRAFLGSEAASSKEALRAAVNGDDPTALRKFIPPALFVLFPRELEAALVPLIADDSAAKAKRLAEIDARLREVATDRERIFEKHRFASLGR